MGLFSISEEEGNYFNDNSGFFELLSCPGGGKSCTQHLNFVNERMKLSRTHWIDKDFPQAIEELRIAFYKTSEIDSPTCFACAELFRATIIKSLETIHKDIRPMTIGFHKRKYNSSNYELATKVLNELKGGMSSSETV